MVLTARIAAAGVLLAVMTSQVTADALNCSHPPRHNLNCENACFSFPGIWMNGTEPVTINQNVTIVPDYEKAMGSYPNRVKGFNGSCTGTFTPASGGAVVTFNAAETSCMTEKGNILESADGMDGTGCGALNAELATSTDFFGGLTAKIVRSASTTTLAWSNGASWTKPCGDFSGNWCSGDQLGQPIKNMGGQMCTRTWQQGSLGAKPGGVPAGCMLSGFAVGYVKGNKVDSDYHGLTAFLELADAKSPGLDRLVWQNVRGNNVTWYRYQNRSL